MGKLTKADRRTVILTAGERVCLGDLEDKVAAGLGGFSRAGAALRQIRDGGLYREMHASFADYLHARWGISRPRGYQLIESAATAERVSTIVDTPLPNEAQARALSRAPAAKQGVLWEEAVSTAPEGRVTAKHVTRTVDGAVDGPKAPPRCQDRRTPLWLYDELNRRFGPFVLDAFAAGNNTLCGKYYTHADDGAKQSWADVTFANPGFGAIEPVLKHATAEGRAGSRSCVVGPVGCSQKWYRKYALLGTVWVPDCRINFHDKAGRPTGARHAESGADRDTIVMTFGTGHWNPSARVARGEFRAVLLELAHLRPEAL